MRKNMLALPIAAWMLTACALGPKPTPTPSPTLSPAASLLARCPDLPPPESGRTTDLLANHVLVAKRYHQCRDNHQGLVRWIKETQQ